jgi:xylan 1,4-beta-xylosidase
MQTYYLNSSQHRRQRAQLFGGLAIMLFLGVATLLSVTQLSVIREFFTQASNEPANIVVDTHTTLGPLPRPWRNLAQGGEEHNWQLKPLAGQVKELKPEYIRIDHIYDFYDIVGGTSGSLTFDFSKLDVVLNDITASGAKPFIALSYMPPAISSGDIISPPQNWNDWQVVVQRTIEHVSGTRGISDVYYEVWNEPDLFGGWHYGKQPNYLTMYNSAARGAANAQGVKSFKIGGPATTALYKNWFDAMAQNAVENNVRWDFFSWHTYSRDIDRFRTDMVDIREWLKAYPTLDGKLELHLTEWGHDSENDPGYDTSYSGAHTVAGSIEMVGVMERAFVFEIQDGKDPNGQADWGRWGMFRHSSVGATPKPRFFALKLLDRMGPTRVQLFGKGSWVKGLAAKKDDGTNQVVLANYDDRGQHTEAVPVAFTYLEPGLYTVTQEFLNGKSQSGVMEVIEHELKLVVQMPANSVVLIEVKKN